MHIPDTEAKQVEADRLSGFRIVGVMPASAGSRQGHSHEEITICRVIRIRDRIGCRRVEAPCVQRIMWAAEVAAGPSPDLAETPLVIKMFSEQHPPTLALGMRHTKDSRYQSPARLAAGSDP